MPRWSSELQHLQSISQVALQGPGVNPEYQVKKKVVALNTAIVSSLLVFHLSCVFTSLVRLCLFYFLGQVNS